MTKFKVGDWVSVEKHESCILEITAVFGYHTRRFYNVKRILDYKKCLNPPTVPEALLYCSDCIDVPFETRLLYEKVKRANQ